MLLFGKRSRKVRIAICAALCLGLSSPSLAGTVYSWQTEDGTTSFTDDKKHIPAKYRDAAKTRKVGSLKGYPRYTPAGRASNTSHEERLSKRLQDLNQVQQPVRPAVQGASPGWSGQAISLGGSRYGSGVRYQIPLNGASQQGSGPVVTETMRAKPSNSLATRTITVVKQDGRIIAVTKSQLNQRNYSGVEATGWDEDDLLR
jgi:hypothetical protein